ncbi:MAG TPA: bifunctional [glutamate--ammonia ligase]-adenylyl-L-tyrosine phosphorylase/[glutamate--ammonia-ligase] adenylyltransferase [Gallionellaceae bacterium]|nr:bifunctional [glutamate--ammonia ligase]-adenylyl-L-tyrosine phosphorylase/[glutamate--ammonia-ligase] adenylyltransferase [Gallionellaceae bacterium]
MNTATPASTADFSALLQRARHASRYVQRLLDADATLQPWLEQHYASPCAAAEMRDWLAALPMATEEELARALRRLRKLVMLKLLTRDLGGLADLDEVMQAMTALAEIALQHAQWFAMRALGEQYGAPIGAESGAPQQLLVIGMGKLGGGELNVSSDIDLIFIYPEDGETNGMRSIGNNDFFTRAGRKIINLINESTADGYVFRVDMRLRPYGDSGALVMSFAALEEYLVTQGREWERYAWIKARVISPPDHPETSALMQLAQPFVFRKYLDFGAFESMRKLHAQIRQEVLRRDRLNNIKLGPGGIREIEFIAQVFQLIRGGRDPRLRIRPTRRVLRQLCENGQLNADTQAALDRAYVFLRNLEHRLQYLEDQQTQDLPEKAEDQAIIAAAMGFADYTAMLQVLDAHRDFVSRNFNEIFSTEETASAEHDGENDKLWGEGLRPETLQTELEALGYRDGAAVAAHLLQLRDGSRYRQLPELSHQRMDKVLPQFIRLCARTANGDDALRRVLKLLEAISRRASYLAFLAEYPQVLQRVAGVCSASEWAADYLVTHPFLLDELLDAREIYRAPDWAALDALLQAQLADSSDDLERAMDILRQFHHSQTFHLLAMDIQGLLPLEKLSDHLSDLADLILRHVLELCWRDARKKHREQHRFAIIAYGKLGGRELGYASDLDLIFLYDDPHPDAGEIYARLAQRINTVLSSYTSAGRLYETDLRLRPNGASGLLVSSVEAFEHYQQKEAWVWEHQALTRARFSAGDAAVGAQFEAIRKQVLRRPRELAELRREILSMRQKMHDGHPNHSELFDIKHDAGGMVDVEFMVQYLVLAYASQHAELTANSGNLALLGAAARLGLIDAKLCEEVQEIYRTLRREQHRMRLNNLSPARLAPGTIAIAPVRELWHTLLGA